MPQFIVDMMEIAVTRVGERVFTSSFDGKRIFQLIFFQVGHPRCVVYDQYMWYKIIVIHNSQLIRSISCISSYMFRLRYRTVSG
jgi:hypothetical protein